MLSKEEIEEAKECLQETIQNTYAERKAVKLNNLSEYIEQLETKEQKLIEKLEKDKNNLEFSRDLDADKGFGEDEEDMAVRVYIEEILKIVKGENDE